MQPSGSVALRPETHPRAAAVTMGSRAGQRVRLLAALAAFLLGGVVPPAVAQETSEPPGAAALALLPPAAAFGEGWVSHADPVRSVPSDAFRDGALVGFGGPAGARVALVAMLVTDDRVAIRAAWEEAGKVFDRYRHDLLYEDQLAEALGALPAPAGCAEAKRIEGTSEQDTFATGVTLCAVDPDIVLLAVASGQVLGATGHRASDAVVATVLAGAPARDDATPAP